MSKFLAAMDNYTCKQFGENGHVEYGWSNNIKETILQFSFQLVRTTEKESEQKLSNKLHDILSILTAEKMTTETKYLLSILYKMIGHTRDIIDGKGECSLTYMMIYVWYKFNPTLAFFALKCLIQDLSHIDYTHENENINKHPYGSWKDIKYFCEYCNSKGLAVGHPLIQYAIQLANDQLKTDYDIFQNNSESNISLVAKWIPREKSHFSWLYEAFATNYFRHYLLTTVGNPVKRFKATLKCKTDYRKVLSKLNKHLDTLQIKQCGQVWSSINFHNVTSVTLSKQKKAFLNTTSTGEVRFPDNEDRVECAEHFKEHIQKAVKCEVEMKGKRIGMEKFTDQARNLLNLNRDQNEVALLNLQWRNNSTQTKSLANMIAMVDVSGSMDGDPMNVAVALGIRIAEKSALGKRVMTFNTTPKWVNLEPYNDFVTQVDVLLNADWGMNTNFHAALNMILDAIVLNKMPAEDVQDMILVVLSDMQIDGGDNCDKKVLYHVMETKYVEAGIRSIGKPYKPPHILFWNLRGTDGFPSLSYQPNVSMMSGFSPALLNLFCEQGVDALQSCTPWSILEKTLENTRYHIMQDKINEIIV